MNWSAFEETLLRERYGKIRTRDLARRFGRTHGAVKQKAMKLGLDSGRAVTAEERQAIRDLYPSCTARQIAERLYGDPGKLTRVFKLAERLGLTKWRFWSDEVLDRVRVLHAEGLTDAGIAARMTDVFLPGDDGRLQARNIRVRLKLAANLDTPAAQESRRRAHRTQLDRLGMVNPNDLRKRAHRQFAERYGLPADLKPAQVRMVLALMDGPRTLPELKAALGLRPESTLSHNGTGSTYQADLCDRGLVARIPTGLAGPVPGPRYRYLLTAACLDLLAAAPTEGT